MSSLRRRSSLPRRVFVHGLVLPFRLGSRHSRGLSSLSHASASVVPLVRQQGCGQTRACLRPFGPSRVASVAPRENSSATGASSLMTKVCFSTDRTVTSFPQQA